jgi:hypothetical protein
MLTLLAVGQMRSILPNARREFRVPGGALGVACAILFPAILCGVKIYYSEPFVWRWAPWLLASGPLAFVVLRWGFGLKPEAMRVTR